MNDPTDLQATSATSDPSDGRTPVRQSRWSKLGFQLGLLIAIVLAFSAVVTTTFAVYAVQEDMYDQSTQSMEDVHIAVSSLISAQHQSILDFSSAALKERRQSLVDVSAPVIAALNELRAAVDRGEMTTTDAQTTALAMLKSVRFGNNDYFFTYDRNMVALAHPNPKFQGQNLLDLQDADGRFIVRDARDVALNQGSGFTQYRWVRLDETIPADKIGYVFHYQPWDWIIGTGVYVDDIEADVKVKQDAVESQLSEEFDFVGDAGDATFFILDDAGDVVVAPAGADLSALKSTPSGAALVTSLLESPPPSDALNVERNYKASIRDGEIEEGVMTVSSFAPLKWLLVSTAPRSELAAPGRQLALQQALLSIVVLIIGLAAGLLLSRRIVRPVESITGAALSLSNGTFDPASLDAAAARKDEVGELARAFRRMGQEILERERKLRERVAQLTVVVDQGKVAKAVNEITETEYFQELKAKADELRNRRD
ncbi:MAG: cache domain-containing protein [Actinobacteria bacterium]|nr:cache domain-containing protein [Actinomycetota bacterium]